MKKRILPSKKSWIVISLSSIAFTAGYLLLPIPSFAQPAAPAPPAPLVAPGQGPAMTSCVVTANSGTGTGSRANVTCTGNECAYKFITNYVQISSRYGPRSSPGGIGSTYHRGIDLAGPVGTKIKALEPGVVLQVTNNPKAGTGYSVEIRDANGRKHSYYHLKTKSSLTVGQQVNAGQEIGDMDSTGNVTGSHLHYQISTPNGDYTDPDVVLKNWPKY